MADEEGNLTACWWPERWADKIYDNRYAEQDGKPVLTLVQVDTDGKLLQTLFQIRRGGGHLELHRLGAQPPSVGFDLIDQKVMIHPENV